MAPSSPTSTRSRTLPKNKSATSLVGGSNLAVFKNSENRDAAWKLAKWLSQPDVQVKWYEATGDLPSVENAWDDPSLKDDEKLAVFGEQLKDTNSPPSVPTWTQVTAAGRHPARADRQGRQGPGPGDEGSAGRGHLDRHR